MDVCLILEGTYPYVSGGVATWVHQLITSMKGINFGLYCISAHADPTRKLQYVLPPNVVYFQELFLHDYNLRNISKRKPGPGDFKKLKDVLEEIGGKNYKNFPQLLELFQGEDACFHSKNIFASQQIWDLLISYYERFAPEISFIDFFWTWRNIYLPVLEIFQAPLPRAKIYHAVSTGYAGLLGVVAKLLQGEKLFITEHGIYTHERKLEIAQASWILDQEQKRPRASREISFFKKWWTAFFQLLSSLAYDSADQVFTLFEGNKIRQILEGCAPEKLCIIPNGILLEETPLLKSREKKGPSIGLVGRVVEIKDIKTFLRAAALVLEMKPETEFYVLGPLEEEKEYAEECMALSEELGLDKKVHFTGKVEMKDFYPILDVLVLTSLSESQPYVILEACWMGIPVVATDVGACREMLEGSSDSEDRNFGKSGLLTPVSSPQKTAEAILELLEHPSLRQQMAHSGRARVKKFYNQEDLLSKYLNFYEQNL
ncbi:MAG: GT4 family glycosyltransferase PelF [Deltaproteobacteria bacterium]|nr:GT4 family glycosyltransferase PelF [Deltaproteobacteria bacterium]